MPAKKQTPQPNRAISKQRPPQSNVKNLAKPAQSQPLALIVQQAKFDPGLLGSSNKLDLSQTKTLTLVKGHTFEVIDQKGDHLQILDNDDGNMYWVKSADLLVDQKAQVSGPVSTTKAEFRNGNIVLTRITNKLIGKFEAEQYLQSALAYAKQK